MRQLMFYSLRTAYRVASTYQSINQSIKTFIYTRWDKKAT